jgi:hypothetical protein
MVYDYERGAMFILKMPTVLMSTKITLQCICETIHNPDYVISPIMFKFGFFSYDRVADNMWLDIGLCISASGWEYFGSL